MRASVARLSRRVEWPEPVLLGAFLPEGTISTARQELRRRDSRGEMGRQNAVGAKEDSISELHLGLEMRVINFRPAKQFKLKQLACENL
jgi:hypothetical protein